MSRIVYTSRHGETERTAPRRWRRFPFVLFFILFVAGSITYAIRYSEWQVAAIRIAGIEVLEEEKVRTFLDNVLGGYYAFVFPKRSIILSNPTELEAALVEVFPRIRSVGIKKKYPDGLIVTVVERKLWGIFCSDECVYIDETGFAFEEAPVTTGSLIRKVKRDGGDVMVGVQAVDALLMEDMLVLEDMIEKEIGAAAVEYELFSKIPSEIRVGTTEGFTLYFNRGGDFDEVFRVLKTVLEKEIGERRGVVEYIDLRFGNKVFYKLRGS